jgi:hypothetical protein
VKDSEQVSIVTKSFFLAIKINFLLRVKFKFRRAGNAVGVLSDDKTFRDFIRGEIKLKSGRDWVEGFYWSASNTESRKFLTEFYQTYCC